MEGFALYLLKSAVCNAIFLGIYILFLKNQTFFRFNRYFLITGVFLSAILPLYTYTHEVTITVTESNAFNTMPIAKSYSSGFWVNVFLSGYLLGVLFFVLRYLLGLIKIKALVNRAGFTQFQGYRMVKNEEVKSSFSAFNYIFIDISADLPEAEKQLILSHELAHVRQYHWADLLLVQFFCILQWINPLAWIYRKALKENHEYLADQAVLKLGTNIAVYRAVLTNQCIGSRVFALSSSFYQYGMPRLKMLSKPSSVWIHKMPSLLILPAIGLFYWSFSETSLTIKAANTKIVNSFPTVKNTAPVVETSTPKGVKKTNKLLSKQSSGLTHANAIPTATSKIVPENASRPLIDTHPVAPPIFIVDGLEVPMPNVDGFDQSTIAEIHVLKDESAIKEFGERGKNGAVIIYTKNHLKTH
ncbi:MAG: M56 family peptidase [Chitinophagaceae bacterium]|nr:MAG: M56 family peptidase [Chitinophagaceae bacterium]